MCDPFSGRTTIPPPATGAVTGRSVDPCYQPPPMQPAPSQTSPGVARAASADARSTVVAVAVADRSVAGESAVGAAGGQVAIGYLADRLGAEADIDGPCRAEIAPGPSSSAPASGGGSLFPPADSRAGGRAA